MSVLSLVKNVFPPPRLMTFPCIGVDISDTSLKYVEFERERAHDTYLKLKQWGDIEVPSGIVERGNVHDVEKLTAVLAQMKEKSGAQYVNISLPEERAYLFETTLPLQTPRSDIRGLLEFRLEENVPLSPRDAYFDYTIVSEDSENHTMHIAVAVYAQSTINSYYEACIKAGLAHDCRLWKDAHGNRHRAPRSPHVHLDHRGGGEPDESGYARCPRES